MESAFTGSMVFLLCSGTYFTHEGCFFFPIYPIFSGPFFRILSNLVKKTVTVTTAAIISLTGSARNTANTLLSKNKGRMKISGIKRMSFLKQASSRLTFACPKAMKVCWQANWKPREKIHLDFTFHPNGRNHPQNAEIIQIINGEVC